MALHFVTSAQAEDHIYSSDDARKTEGMIGSGGFVLGVKNKLSASMIDANTLRILEGDIIFCGRHVNINNYEEVTIQNGTPGMNSIALVVLSLKTDPSEEATIKVYEGEETEGDPVTPEYIQGDLNNGDTEAEMPLYTITKTGLSVGDPVAQFEVWVSEKEFRDSVSQQMGVKLLWSSTLGMAMNGSQSCTLSEPVSEQAHGIVLHWVYRDSNDYAQNQQHQFFFFPKTTVDEDYWGTTAGGKAMFLTTSTGRFTTKYVYISDNVITGHERNSSDPYTAGSGGG